MRIWTDPRDGRAWEFRNRARGTEPRSLRIETDGLADVELVHFRHPPGRAPQAGGAAPNPGGRRVQDLDDTELQALLDHAVGRA